ncbi:MAG TPA: carboxypeptidase regulatory-like domain-containing protein, partial [Acidobacteriota bacterium]|nr:carboxypeptidase regulatory-like domain-containing protein [Acidobacteriota bacterium]
MKKSLVLLCLFLVGLIGSTALAQTPTGTVDGTVRDESGAVIPGAEILLTNKQTNAKRTAITDDEGRFRITNVPSGQYHCEAKLTGFKTTSAEFKLDVAGLQTLNFNMQVGDITETVEVSGAVQKVNTEEGTLSSVVSGRQVEDLPLNGRNVFQLALLQPGVTAGINDGIGGQSDINASGNRTRGNNFSLDGVSNNDPITGGATSVTPNLDSVQEFRIQNNNFSAEFGRNNGAVVNVVTKSGTNEFHGTAYWFHRNNSIDAREYFDGEDTAPLRQHQAGFTIGGPVIRDKTFFFGAFEGIRTFSGESTQGRFETPELRQLVQQQAPNSLAAQFFQAFPGPTPTADFDDVGSISGDFQAAGPLDGIPDVGTANFFSPNDARSYQYNVRLDHEVTDNNKLFFRYIWQTSETPSNNIRAAELGNDFDGHFANGVISDTHIFSPTVVNEIRYGYNRTRTDFNTPRFDITDFNIFNFAGGDGITGFGAYGGTPQFFTAEEYHLVDVVSINVGDHGIKTGFEYRWNQDDSDFQFLTRGYVAFAGVFDFISELPSEVSARVDPRVEGQLPLVGTPHNFRQSEWAFFIQDDWKVSDRLTLNL